MGISTVAAVVGTVATVASAANSMANSGSASQASQSGYNQASDTQWRMYQQNRADMAPWRDVGQGALNMIWSGLQPAHGATAGYSYQVPTYNGMIWNGSQWAPATYANTSQYNTGGGATTGNSLAGGGSSGGSATPAPYGPIYHTMGDTTGGTATQSDTQSQQLYPNTWANRLFKRVGTPMSSEYPGTATIPSGVDASGYKSPADYYERQSSQGDGWGMTTINVPGSDATEAGRYTQPDAFAFDPNQLYNDPSYQFRQNESRNSTLAAGAASGAYGSGNLGNALMTRSGELASQEYTNVYNRSLGEYMLQYQQRMDEYNKLATLAGYGQTQSQAMGVLGANAATAIGNNQIGAGNAAAAGYISQGNALTSGIGGLANSLQNQMSYNRLFGGGSGGNSYTGSNWYDSNGNYTGGSWSAGSGGVTNDYYGSGVTSDYYDW